MFPRHRNDKRQGPRDGPAAKLPLEEGPCPSCTAMLDNWDGAVLHVEGLGANVVAVAKAPIEHVVAFAADHGWRHLKLISPPATVSSATIMARMRKGSRCRS